MPNGQDQEVEVKFACDAATLAQVLTAYELKEPKTQHVKALNTIYFDTADRRLRKAHAILRLRWSDGKEPVLCFKHLAPNETEAFHRVEVERSCLDGRIDISLFDGETAAWLQSQIKDAALEKQFELKVKRETLLVAHGGAEIEISADQGLVIAGDRSAPLVELELELKSGKEAGLYDLAAILLEKFPISLSFTTKSERGFLLVGENSTEPVAMPPLRLSASQSLDEVIAACLSQSLYLFTTYWHDLGAGDASVAIHQMRVALRRLRTFASIFAKAYPGPPFQKLKRDARDLNIVLGKARNCEVLAEIITEAMDGAEMTPSSRGPLTRRLEEEKIKALAEARDFAHARKASQFVLKSQHLIATRGWVMGQTKAEKTLFTGKFLSQSLTKLHARVLKRGQNFARLDTEELHSLRLALKALSSALAAFASMIEQSNGGERFQTASLKLQRGLGTLNDNKIAVQFLESIAYDETLLGYDETARLLKLLNHKIGAKREKLARAWRKFKDLPTYWTASTR